MLDEDDNATPDFCSCMTSGYLFKSCCPRRRLFGWSAVALLCAFLAAMMWEVMRFGGNRRLDMVTIDSQSPISCNELEYSETVKDLKS